MPTNCFTTSPVLRFIVPICTRAQSTAATPSPFGAGVGVSAVESGTVYGPDGKFGCYLTECIGVETNAGISAYATVGLTLSYDDFKGEALVSVQTVGGVVSFSTAQVFSLDGNLVGTSDSVSLGVSVFPITAGFYNCNTIVDTVGVLDDTTGGTGGGIGQLIPVSNEPPVAACADTVTCADAVTCVAGASIDNGSVDPDGDPLSLSQSPAAPYTIGARTVTLTATDTEGAFDSCTAEVTVDDCTSPEVSCPAPSTAECESVEQAVVDPGDATATDTCSDVTVNDPGASSFPLGTTPVVYTATDGAGNTAECVTTVTVQDTTDPVIVCPADVTVECDGAGNTAELNDWLAAATASDGCGDVTITHDFTALSDECGATGSATVIWTVEDVGGNTASCAATFTIVDTTRPSVSCSVTTAVLWSPNHGLKEVGLQVSVFDACDQTGASESLLIEVWSDETEIPGKGDGTGKHAPDAKDVYTGLRLRNERRGREDGRVYLIVATAKDGCANTGFGFCTVLVPHDQNEEGLAEVQAQSEAALAAVQSVAASSASVADVVAPLVVQGWTRHGVGEEMGPHQ